MDRFHAALPVSDNRILVCGGCSAIGALQDVHIFNTGEYVVCATSIWSSLVNKIKLLVHNCSMRLVFSTKTDIGIHFHCVPNQLLCTVNPPALISDTNMWSSVASPLLCSRPRAGHSMINLGCSILTDAEKHQQGENVSVHCTLLVFGGSDCSGTFYNDTVKCTVEVPGDKWWIHLGRNPNRKICFYHF